MIERKVVGEMIKRHKKEYKKEVLKLAKMAFEAIENGHEDIKFEFSSFTGGYSIQIGSYWSYMIEYSTLGTNFYHIAYQNILDNGTLENNEEEFNKKLLSRLEVVKNHQLIINRLSC